MISMKKFGAIIFLLLVGSSHLFPVRKTIPAVAQSLDWNHRYYLDFLRNIKW
jgi:hypothetical protein